MGLRHGSRGGPGDDVPTILNINEPRPSLSVIGPPHPESENVVPDPELLRAREEFMVAPPARSLSCLFFLKLFRPAYARLFASLATFWQRLVGATGLFCAIAAGVPLPIIGVIFGRIIDAFPPDEKELQVRIAQLLGVAVAYFAFTTTYTLAFSVTGDQIARTLRRRIFVSLMHLDQAYYDTHDLDTVGLLGEKIDSIQVGTSEKLGIFIQSISYFVAAFTVGFILYAQLTGILLASVMPIMILLVSFGSTVVSKSTRRMSQFRQKATAVIETSLRSISIVQAFDMMDRICKTYQEHLDESSRYAVRKSIASAIQLGGTYSTAHAANGLAFYLGSHYAASGSGGSGTVYAVVFLILDASFVVGQFAPFLEIFARAASAHDTVREILNAASADACVPTSTHPKVNSRLHGQAIKFENVRFSYPARPAVKALNDLTLTLQPGQFNAVLGTSGGGKSTLVSLLLRIYEYSGRIYIGHRELHELDITQLREAIAVVDQESALFSGTIFDNICYGLIGQDVGPAERQILCEQAIKDAAVDFLADLPEGVHTQLDNTMTLSGGQRQRICLARALIRQPAILVLDEPTSALDAQSEMKVIRAVKRASAKGTTVLMIAHRLSTTLDTDKIIILDNGRVVEEGTPAQLSQRESVFRSLLEAQNTNVLSPSPEDDEFEGEKVEFDGTSKVSEPTYDSNGEDVELPTRDVISKVARSARQEYPLILTGIIASIINGSIMLAQSVIFGNIVQLLNTETGLPGYQGRANFLCLMFFVLACIALLSYASSGTAFGIASARLTTRLEAQVLRRVLQLDTAWFSQPGRSAHELSSGYAKDIGDLSCLSGVALGTIFTATTAVAGGIILAHAIAWKIAIVLLAAVPVMVAAGYVRLRMLAKAENLHRTVYNEATAIALEACRNRRTVSILRLEDTLLLRYEESLEKPRRKVFRSFVFTSTLLAVSFAITYFVYALAYWWGAKQVRDGTYTEKQFFIVLPALLFSAQSSGQLFSLSPEITRARAAATNVFKTLAYEPNVPAPPPKRATTYLTGDSTDSSPERPACEKCAKIEFDSVSFAYPGHHNRSVLTNVSFSIHNGETVAFVGPSGAGKSSIIGLMERFHDPNRGSVLFDGSDVRLADVRELRNAISLVPQASELFPGSIEDNIKLGALNTSVVTHAEVEEASRLSGLHDFITSLPDGYNTDCGSIDSSQLSGGQRQRIALARALIRHPQILLLDEPTSALDAHSERQVQNALLTASQNRTTIIVAHRLASIQHVDKIIVMDRGEVVDIGTHSELVAKGGLYASMAKVQALT